MKKFAQSLVIPLLFAAVALACYAYYCITYVPKPHLPHYWEQRMRLKSGPSVDEFIIMSGGNVDECVDAEE